MHSNYAFTEMPNKFKLRRHRKNEDHLKTAKKQRNEEALGSFVVSLPLSAFTTVTTDNIKVQCWDSYFVKVTSYILHITCN